MDIATVILVILGLVFFTGGTIGILRFPDFFTRLHPAGKLDTLGSFLMVTAVSVFVLKDFSTASLLTSLKLFLILVFIFLSSPTATHSIVDAAVRAGLEPWTKSDRSEKT